MTALEGVAALGLVIAALWLGIRVYDFLTGRKLLQDLRDKRRLERKTLSEWDAWCDTNPRESDIVVCLTTTPSRIGHVEATLRSLLAQSRRPRRIRLHLPEFSVREGRPYVVPKPLYDLRCVDIVQCVDDGPATKLIPALKELPADQPILVVDDDMLYPPDMVDAFHHRAHAMPDVAHTFSGWVVPDDLTDRPTNPLSNILQPPPVPRKCSRIRREQQIDIFQGYAGFLVRPRFFDLDRLTDYEGAPPQARTVDDVWLSGHCRVPKFVFPHPRYPFISWRSHQLFIRTSLGRINRGSGDPAERANTIVVKHLRDRWMTSAGRAADRPSH